MNLEELKQKETIFIKFLQSIINDNTWNLKAEYSTNDNDTKVIIIQEQTGEKVIFYGNCEPLYNYYMIDIYGTNIREEKELSVLLQSLVGRNHYFEVINDNKKQKWQIMLKQFSNFQAIEYLDIKRVGYNSTVQTIINKINEEAI